MQERDKENSFNQSVRVLFGCLFLIFPMVVRTMIDANLCRKLNKQDAPWQDEWLMVDLDISCEDQKYNDNYIGWFRLAAVLYPLGVPAFTYGYLSYSRSQLRQQYGNREGLERFKERFEFLVRDYKVPSCQCCKKAPEYSVVSTAPPLATYSNTSSIHLYRHT